MKKNIPYQKATNTSLIILWIGAVLFCISMLYTWTRSDRKELGLTGNVMSSDNIFVDQLLLSYKDYQLDGKVNLININLNTEPATSEQDAAVKIIPDRKLVYSKILEQKCKNIFQKTQSDGFTIKPLPHNP